MSNPYLAVLRTPHALPMVLVAFVGRLPLSMVGLGCVLLVASETGSYGLGGSVAATLRIVPVTGFVAKNCDAVAVRGLTVRAPGTTAIATLPRAGKACSGKIAKPQLSITPVAAL